MAIPTLESMDAWLDANCTDILGDLVAYADDGTTYTDLRMHVNYADGEVALNEVQAIAQNINISLMKSRVPAKPGADTRIQFPKIPGRTFRPINVASDESGTHWLFEVKDVPHVEP